MTANKLSALLIATGVGAFALGGCSSSSSCGDAGCPDASTSVDSDAAPSDGETVFGLSDGTFCFDVTAITFGFSDGCGAGVNKVATDHDALPVTYTAATGVIEVGTDGSLGQGSVSHNVGTLMRDGTTSDATMASCSWHQTDTSNIMLTASNTFTISVTETQSSFAAACTAPPAGGSCTSNWQWTMMIDTGKSPANGCM